ncbi:WD repeat-containing protein 55, partial [Tremellales sp. Uapishka_1]
MPDIRLKNQPFDLAFHPSSSTLYSSLLTGEVKAYSFDEETGETKSTWTARPSKKTARCLDVEESGDAVWMGGKSGALFRLDARDGLVKSEFADAHESPINRVKCINANLLASGDDEGVIKFWDPRQESSIRTYSQHFDYISDFLYFDDERQLITTGGDGHLSVIDIRSSKPNPMCVSDDQEDELLSIVPIKGDTKCLVGTGLGILSIWSRKSGFGDCVDRIPGHPASIDALVALTPDIVASGSEDGMIRVMQILPNKFLGVIATHEEFPIERMKLSHSRRWLGSVSHDECIKLTDVEDLFEESDGEDEENNEDEDDGMEGVEGDEGKEEESRSEREDEPAGEDEEMDSDDSEDRRREEKARRKAEKSDKRGKGKGGMGDMGMGVDKDDKEGFFDDL